MKKDVISQFLICISINYVFTLIEKIMSKMATQDLLSDVYSWYTCCWPGI